MSRAPRSRVTIVIGTLIGLMIPNAVIVNADDSAYIHARSAADPLGSTYGETTNRLIVRLREAPGAADPTNPARVQAQGTRSTPMSAAQARALEPVARTSLMPLRQMGSGAQVVRLTHDMPLDEVQRIAARLMQDPTVEHAEPDRRKFPLLVPGDPLYAASPIRAGQWNLHATVGGINAEPAWSLTTGSAGTVIAVLDTGVLPNNLDLVGRLVSGYDFVSAEPDGTFKTANDGDGRDADPSDPGNWISALEAGQPPFTDCTAAQNSDWHGTHTAGIIGASANGYGVTGINWSAKLQAVRVLGKCGGYTSDIIDGLRWAGGLSVPGIPANPTPAHIVNMSLGGTGACSNEMQAAIDAVLNAGTTRAIITAAGNQAGASENISPGNCKSVINVTAHDINGVLAPYANVGSNVALSAPGGYFSSNAGGPATDRGILSLFNAGQTTPSTTDAFAWVIGTSEAAAHVSGIASLMITVNGTLKPYQIYAILRASARPFAAGACPQNNCGAGMADALGAVQQASAPPADQGIGFGGGGPISTASSGGGGGGGGGCSLGGTGPGDYTLLLLAVIALARLLAGQGLMRRVAIRRRPHGAID